MRESMIPLLRGLKGYHGIVIMGNQETHEGTVISYWKTEEDMMAADWALAAVRARATKVAQALPGRIEVYEVPVAVRARPPVRGCWVRVTELVGPAESAQDSVASFREVVVPACWDLPGFVSSVLFVLDRQETRLVVMTGWQSVEAMLASEALLARFHSEAAVERNTAVVRSWSAQVQLVDIPASFWADQPHAPGGQYLPPAPPKPRQGASGSTL